MPVGPVRRLAVLIIDDNRDCTDSLAELLRLSGHEARTSYAPAEAVRAVDGWCRATVLRAAPCLLGLYSVLPTGWTFRFLVSSL